MSVKSCWRLCSAIIRNLFRNPLIQDLKKKSFERLKKFNPNQFTNLFYYIIYRLDLMDIHLQGKVNEFVSKLFEMTNYRKEVNLCDLYIRERYDFLMNIYQKALDNYLSQNSLQLNFIEFMIINYRYGICD